MKKACFASIAIATMIILGGGCQPQVALPDASGNKTVPQDNIPKNDQPASVSTTTTEIPATSANPAASTVPDTAIKPHDAKQTSLDINKDDMDKLKKSIQSLDAQDLIEVKK